MAPALGKLTLRKMTRDDARTVFELTKQEHWGLDLTDVTQVLDLSPDLSVVACMDDKIVGGTTVSVHGARATLGQVIVDTEHRGMGIGDSMMQSVLERLDSSEVDLVELIGMKGTEEFYERYGFREVEGVLLVSGTWNPAGADLPPRHEVRTVSDLDLGELEDLVHRTIGQDRWFYVEVYRREFPELSVGLWLDDTLVGYVQARHTDTGNDIGPWVLEGPTATVADGFLSSALRTMSRTKTYTWTPSNNRIAVELLARRGVIKRDRMKRFVRTENAVQPFDRSVFSLCSAEFV